MTAEPGTILLILVATLLVFTAGVWAYASAWSQEAALASRSNLGIDDSRARRVRARADAYLRRTYYGRALSLRLQAAGIPLTALEFLVVALAVGIASYLVLETLVPEWLAAIGGVLGARACWAYVERRRNRRRDEFIQQLPEIARILSNASAAGLAISSAVQMAAKELSEPARSEMALVAEEVRLGQALEAALENLEARMPAREVGVLISTLIIQQRAGGDLVRALQDMALTLDARRDLYREIRTLMAGSVFTGYLVAMLGIGSILVLNLISPGVLDKMTSQVPGQVAFAIAGGLYLIGFLLIKRVTAIEV